QPAPALAGGRGGLQLVQPPTEQCQRPQRAENEEAQKKDSDPRQDGGDHQQRVHEVVLRSEPQVLGLLLRVRRRPLGGSRAQSSLIPGGWLLAVECPPSGQPVPRGGQPFTSASPSPAHPPGDRSTPRR